MEQNIQPNVDNLLNSFSERMGDAFDEIKKTMTQELTGQVNKNTYMCKMNRAGEPLYPDKGITLKAIYGKVFSRGVQGSTLRIGRESSQVYFKYGENVQNYFINTDIQFQTGEYIVNYKYQIDVQKFTFVFIITNFGSVVIKYFEGGSDRGSIPDYYLKLNLIHRGKFKLTDDILYIFNEIVNAMHPTPHPSDIYQIDNAVTTHNYGSGIFVEARYLKKYAAIITLMETYQNNYVKPLIEYNAQKIVDETAELNAKRYELNRIKVEQEMERIKLLYKERQIERDLVVYSNIQNLEAKFNEIKKYKDSLDLYAKQLDADRKQLTADKNKLEKQRGAMKSDRVDESVYGVADVVLDDGGGAE